MSGDCQLAAAKFIGRMSTGLFAGSCVYGTLVHHPSLMDLDDKAAVDAFISMFKRAAPSQLFYCVVAAVSGGYIVYSKPDEKNVLYSSLLMASILPYTKFFMMKTNNAINHCPTVAERGGYDGHDSAYKNGKAIVKSWGYLHAVRSVIGLTAFSLLVYKMK